ncbi:MAG: hypothetical protein J7604_01990 [Sporocytophaga sp.]|uniref:hypothetical protein n=1 Tax=Sporocytophaga sp. TaxID=2231183 RepID=UPI001B1CC1BB|nr:hypothetical protein [Sporocytophaga sp.]MBO9698946.1 hypothetical protein [Sporocytophaga sp.]
MNIGEETLELIDRYLSGDLTESEKKSFNQRLAQDAEFKTWVENQKFANELILGDRLYSLKSMMDEDFSSGKVKGNQNALKNGRIFLFGGMALVASALMLFFMFRKENVKEKNIAVDLTTKESNQNSNINSFNINPTISSLEKDKKAERNSKKLNDIAKLSEPAPLEGIGKVDALAGSDNKPEVDDINEQHNIQSLPQEAEVRCAVKTIHAKMKSEPACIDREDGRLIIVKILDHVNPLAYGITTVSGDTLWQSSNIFSNISSGTYAVSVKDANGCRMQIKELVEVGAKECKKTQQTYSFNPAYGETVTIKVESAGTMTIRNRAGIVVFSGNVSSGEDFNWDGQNSSGGISAPGLYIYLLEDNNGNSVRGEILIY